MSLVKVTLAHTSVQSKVIAAIKTNKSTSVKSAKLGQEILTCRTYSSGTSKSETLDTAAIIWTGRKKGLLSLRKSKSEVIFGVLWRRAGKGERWLQFFDLPRNTRDRNCFVISINVGIVLLFSVHNYLLIIHLRVWIYKPIYTAYTTRCMRVYARVYASKKEKKRKKQLNLEICFGRHPNNAKNWYVRFLFLFWYNSI